MDKDLIKRAQDVIENSYAPYSNFHVASCLKMKDGTFITGVNVENASYGATNCAERSALFACYSKGYRKEDIEAISIVTDGDFLAGPCGVCRQVITELMPENAPVYMSNGELEGNTLVGDLIPTDFKERNVI